MEVLLGKGDVGDLVGEAEEDLVAGREFGQGVELVFCLGVTVANNPFQFFVAFHLGESQLLKFKS